MTRFDPFAELVRFEPFRYPRAAWRAAPEIRMEDSVDAKAYRAEAEIPGVNNEDLKAAIAGNQV